MCPKMNITENISAASLHPLYRAKEALHPALVLACLKGEATTTALQRTPLVRYLEDAVDAMNGSSPCYS
jgi:hypothetical protein